MEGSVGQCQCNGNVTVNDGRYLCGSCMAEVELRCGACGRESQLRRGVFPRFCSGCRKPFRGRIAKIKCLHCGELIDLNEGDQFCPDCSAPLPVPRYIDLASGSSLSFEIIDGQTRMSGSLSVPVDLNCTQRAASLNSDSSDLVHVVKPALSLPGISSVGPDSAAASVGATEHDIPHTVSPPEGGPANSPTTSTFEVIGNPSSLPGSSSGASIVSTVQESLSLHSDTSHVDSFVSGQDGGLTNLSSNSSLSYEVIGSQVRLSGNSSVTANANPGQGPRSLHNNSLCVESVEAPAPIFPDNSDVDPESVPATGETSQDAVARAAENVVDDQSIQPESYRKPETSSYLPMPTETEDANTLSGLSPGAFESSNGVPIRRSEALGPTPTNQLATDGSDRAQPEQNTMLCCDGDFQGADPVCIYAMEVREPLTLFEVSYSNDVELGQANEVSGPLSLARSRTENEESCSTGCAAFPLPMTAARDAVIETSVSTVAMDYQNVDTGSQQTGQSSNMPSASSDSSRQGNASKHVITTEDEDQEKYEDASDNLDGQGSSVDGSTASSVSGTGTGRGQVGLSGTPDNQANTLKPVDGQSEGADTLGLFHPAQSGKDGESLTVEFYVCVPPSFSFSESDGDIPHVLFNVGGRVRRYPMVKTRLFSHHWWWSLQLPIPSHYCIQGETLIDYVYMIYNGTARRCVREQPYSQGRFYEWRKLSIPKLSISNTDGFCFYRQYDIMLPEYPKGSYEPLQPQGFWDSLKRKFDSSSRAGLPTLRDKILGDANFCLRCFLPDLYYSIVEYHFPIDAICHHFTTILSCPWVLDIYIDQQSRDELFEILVAYITEQEAKYKCFVQVPTTSDSASGVVVSGGAGTFYQRIVFGLTLLRFIKLCSLRDIEVRSTEILKTLGVRPADIVGVSKTMERTITDLGSWIDMLGSVMVAAAHAGQSAWLNALPLYYELTGNGSAHPIGNERSLDLDSWFALDDTTLKKIVRAFKKTASCNSMDVAQWFAQLVDILNGSWYTSRMFVAMLSCKQLLDAMRVPLDLPVDAYAAAVLLYCTDDTVLFSPEQMTEAATRLLAVVEKLLPFSGGTHERLDDELKRRLDNVYYFVVELAKVTLQDISFQQWPYVVAIMRLMAVLQFTSHAIDNSDTLTVDDRETVVDDVDHHEQIEEITYVFKSVLCRWLDFSLEDFEANGLCKVRNPTELEMWEALFSVDWHSKVLDHSWKQLLDTTLRGRVAKVPSKAKVDIYCFYARTGTRVDSILQEAAIRDAVEVMQAPPPLERYAGIGCLQKLGYLISAAFREEVKPFDSTGLMQLMLNWRGFDLAVKIALGPYHSVLAEDVVLKITECSKIVKQACLNLHSGSVQYCALEDLLRNKVRFIELCRIFRQSSDQKDSTLGIEECIDLRGEEKSFFEHTRSGLEIFLGLCNHIKNVHTSDLASKLQSISKEDTVSKLWTVRKYQDKTKIDCLYFSVTRSLLTSDVLDKMRTVHKSLLFIAYLEDEGKEFAGKTVGPGDFSIEKVVNSIWPSAYRRFDEYKERLKSGKATFADGDYFLKVYDSKSGIITEVDTMFIDKSVAIKVSERLDMYSKLRDYKKGAKVMLELKDKFKLTGNFSDLGIFIDFDKDPEKRKLSDLTRKLIQAGSQLMAFEDEERVRCLEAFIECKDLVEWVKETVKDQRELKVFVDLAIVVAGENARHLARAASFRESVTGYSQLIYNLNPSAGLADFLDRCKVLWTSLANDPNLANKLRETKNALSWFKNVKASLGSLEQTSLQQATWINETGMYKIGLPAAVSAGRELTFSDTVDVVVGEEADRKLYTYDDLCELQNKLMLVAGQAQQDTKEVDRFVNMFRSVHHLATAFIKIHTAGTIWFDKFTVNIQHDRENLVQIAVNGGIPEVQLTDTCSIMDCADIVSKLADALQKCYDEWTELVAEMRKKYKLLNYFTIKQIAFLKQQLGNFRMLHQCDEKVYPLLAMLHRCSSSDLQAAMVEALARSRRNGETVSTSTCDKSTEITDGTTSLSSKLRSKWRIFLDVAQHSHDNQAQFLSFELLGCFLDSLVATNVGRTLPVRMQAPASLPRGRPHLVVCPKREVFPCALSIYVDQTDTPLPTRNVFLVCCDTTTKEEVALFLERSFHDDELLYCVIHAEKLSYEVCDFIERRIDADFASGTFLAFFCAEESEDRSRLVTALQRFRTKSFSTASCAKICSYIFRHFQQLLDGDGAAVLLKEQCMVRAVVSNRAGMGKTLHVRRMGQRLSKSDKDCAEPAVLTIQLSQQNVDPDKVIERLLNSSLEPSRLRRRIVHINVFQDALNGVNEILFNLLVLGSVCSKDGMVYQRSSKDYYMIEFVNLKTKAADSSTWHTSFPVIEMLPMLECISPVRCCHQSHSGNQKGASASCGVDDEEFMSHTWQRPCQYLLALENNSSFDINLAKPRGTKDEMLQTLLRHCGIKDPSWSELHHFVLFLNCQLVSFEQSAFCNDGVANDLPDFQKFVLKFLLQMSRDFATRSLSISEESPEAYCLQDAGEEFLKAMIIKRRWESSSHPYLFFNPDRTITFLGFCVERRTGNIVAPGSRKIIQEQVMSRDLFDALERNKVTDLTEDFDNKPRKEKLKKICSIMGIQKDFESRTPDPDPDPQYELTMDNVKKILAIHMRFRCGIPVIIMGETGCGKTKLVTFMCKLQVPKRRPMENLVLLKIHGGVTAAHVKSKVKDAYELAKRNRKILSEDPALAGCHVDTILFLDEANTTEAIGLIKEVLCDDSLDGDPLHMQDVGLRIIAAVNPYRKHSAEMIKRLERAGLGYRVDVSKTSDVLGSIPMRHLVYRVRPLPHSLLPLVWDFGQLSAVDEQKYIVQMVAKHLHESPIAVSSSDILCKAVAKVLAKCQELMRTQKEECSFVSLRDVDRALRVMMWFYNMRDQFNAHHREDTDSLTHEVASTTAASSHSTSEIPEVDDVTRSLILAIGVCYHACLQSSTRPYFKYSISSSFTEPLKLPQGEKHISCEIERCQDLFTSNVLKLTDPNISLNHALKENIFMMVVCIELRIPLFLVGKPGSSKSLAKSIVAEAMLGENSQSPLFKHLKQAQLMSFQCSPLATAEGIVKTFKHCAGLQKDSNLDTFVAVVVLDEIGLAEDSERMPLKTLHPLLEDGCEGDEKPEKYMKCGFIGISNWALDPAKMNRGILVQRGVPGKKELADTARGICQFTKRGYEALNPTIDSLLAAYLKLFQDKNVEKEFFGLRDFYSLMKMLAYFADKNDGRPSPAEFRHAILRNFGGLEKQSAYRIFADQLVSYLNDGEYTFNPIELIESALNGTLTKDGGESRYLLVIAENFTALNLVQTRLHSQGRKAEIIFGSQFSKDLDYIQVCRNINRVKVCMEAGKTVVLLNLESLYESLYDALNQYYVRLGDYRYVDLGLGTHRVKCNVHPNFRLIIIANKKDVRDRSKYPTPLINRLEKHYVDMSSLLSPEQRNVVQQLEDWVRQHSGLTPLSPGAPESWNSVGDRGSFNSISNTFIGYSDDAAASVVMQVSSSFSESGKMFDLPQVLEKARYRLLWSAAPDAVLRAKAFLTDTDYTELHTKYFQHQQHTCLADFLLSRFKKQRASSFFQVTTHYKLLSHVDAGTMKSELSDYVDSENVEVIDALQAVETEQQFTNAIRRFFAVNNEKTLSKCQIQKPASILLVQCDSAHSYTELIACARHIIDREYNEVSSSPSESAVPWTYYVIFLLQVNRGTNLTGLHGGKWRCVHIDDLRRPKASLPLLHSLESHSIGNLLSTALYNDSAPAKFDVFDLLRSCVLEAASRLRDDDGRSEARLRLLNRLFNSERGDAEFQRKFAELLVMLLLRLEKTSTKGLTTWLSNDAASMSNIQRHCTFRRSLEACVESKIVPAFAVIISYIDANCNLDLIESQDAYICQLWRSTFGDKVNQQDLCERIANAVGDLVYASGRNHVPVIHRSITGRIFKSKLPFSWLLKEQFDDALVREANAEQPPIFGCFISNVESRLSTVQEREKVACSYAHDLVHMSYRWHTEIDLEVAVLSLSSATKVEEPEARPSNDQLTKAPSSMANVHRCFVDLRKRFDCLSSIMEFLPHELKDETLKELRGESERDALEGRSRMQSHLLSLRSLLHYINQLIQASKENEWRNLVLRSHCAIEDTLMCPFDQKEDEQSPHIVNSCRTTWRNLKAARLFFDYVVTAVSHGANPFDSGFSFDGTDTDRLVKELVKTELNTRSGLESIKEFLNTCRDKLQTCRDNAQRRSFEKSLSLFHGRVLSDVVLPECVLESELLDYLLSVVCDEASQRSGNWNPTAFQVYLLQQLLRHASNTAMKRSLSSYLCMEGSTFQCAIALPLLFIDCYEDVEGLKRNCALGELVSKEACKFAASTFGNPGAKSSCVDKMADKAIPIAERLRQIALFRLSTIICAELMCRGIALKEERIDSDSLYDLCNDIEDVRLFLSKYIVRKYGFSRLYELLEETSLSFIMPTEIRKSKMELTFIDPYYIGHSDYGTCREKMLRCLKGNSDTLEEWLRSCNDPLIRKITVIQALCSCVAMDRMQKDSFIKPEGLSKVEQIIQDQWSDAKNLCGCILRPLPRTGKLDLHRDLTVLETLLTLLVYRVGAVLQSCCKERTLLSPLCRLLVDPKSMHESFFPAMESDLLQFWTSDRVCPQGHIRVGKTEIVIDSDNSWIRCSACKSESCHGTTEKFIYQPARKRGYLLSASTSGQMPASTNYDVKPLTLVVSRVLLHAALCASAAMNEPASLLALLHESHVHAGIIDTNLVNFFWERLYRCDLHLLQSLLNKSTEECLIFLHCIVAKLETLKIDEAECRKEWDWHTAQKCDDWEYSFQQNVVVLALQDYEQVIFERASELLNDSRPPSGRSLLVQLIVESNNEQTANNQEATSDLLYRHPSVWYYRDVPSIRQFKANFERYLCSSKDARQVQHYGALEVIFRHLEQVKAIRYLPDIVKLSIILQRTYGGCFSPTLVHKLTVQQFYDKYLKEQPNDIWPTIDAFISTWNSVRRELPSHSFWCGGKLHHLKPDICNEEMNWDSPARMVFLSERQQWFCPLALVTYLVKIHNVLLGKFVSDYSEKLEMEVDLMDASETHLVWIDPEKDLLPIVLANRQTAPSAVSGLRQSLEYDFDAIQLHVIDRFLRHKRPVSFSSRPFGSGSCIPSFRFHQRRTTGREMAKLSDIMVQERLPAQLKDEIRRIYNFDIAELSDSLVLLDRVIAFFSSATQQCDCSLSVYVQDKLQIKNIALPPTVGEKCRLRQIKALWLFLSFERDCAFVMQNMQVKPENMKDCYGDSLPSIDSKENLKRALKSVNNKQALAYFLELLYEFILIMLVGDEDSMPSPDEGLWSVLKKYDKKHSPGEANLSGAASFSFKCLEEQCGTELLLRHALSVWHEAVLFSQSCNRAEAYSA